MSDPTVPVPTPVTLPVIEGVSGAVVAAIVDEPALIEEPKEPYFKALVASIWIFGAYLALAYVAVTRHWVLESKDVGLATFTAATFGLTVITVFSAVAWPFRMLAGSIPIIGKHLFHWKEPEPDGLLACAMCSGMWIGSILAALGVSVFPVHSALDLVAHGLIGSGATWLLYAITHKLGAYSH